MKASDFQVGDKIESKSGAKGVVHPLHAKNSGGVRVMVELENGTIGSFLHWELKKVSA